MQHHFEQLQIFIGYTGACCPSLREGLIKPSRSYSRRVLRMDLVLLRKPDEIMYAPRDFRLPHGVTPFSQSAPRILGMKLRQLAQDFFVRSSCTFGATSVTSTI